MNLCKPDFRFILVSVPPPILYLFRFYSSFISFISLNLTLKNLNLSSLYTPIYLQFSFRGRYKIYFGTKNPDLGTKRRVAEIFLRQIFFLFCTGFLSLKCMILRSYSKSHGGAKILPPPFILPCSHSLIMSQPIKTTYSGQADPNYIVNCDFLFVQLVL